MFTGIIQAVGRIRDNEEIGDGLRIHVEAPVLGLDTVKIGDSIAINGACCEAASSAHAPSSAYMPIEFVWNTGIQRMPRIAPPEAPNAMPGCNTPPEAPERIVINVTIALATKDSSNTGITARSMAL